MISFATFLDAQPDMTPHMRRIYLLLDAVATRIGRDRAANGIDYRQRAEQHARAGLTWLSCINRAIAKDLDIDARLSATTDLYGWAASGQAGEISTTHVNFYEELLCQHIAQAQQPAKKEAA